MKSIRIAATKSLISEIGATLIMVEHQEERAIEIADKIWRIVDGKVIEEMVK